MAPKAANGRRLRKYARLNLKLKPEREVVLPTTEPSPSQASGLGSDSHLSTTLVLQFTVLLLTLLLVLVMAIVTGVAAQAYFLAGGRLSLDVADDASSGAGWIRSERSAEAALAGPGLLLAGSDTTPTVMPAPAQASAPAPGQTPVEARAPAPVQAPAPVPAQAPAPASVQAPAPVRVQAPAPVPAQAPAPAPAKAPAPALKSEVLIPDRLLVLGPQHNRTGDWGVGLKHTQCSQSCAAAVAFTLNRTLVVHRHMRLPRQHTREAEDRLVPREAYFELGSKYSKGLHIVYEDEVQHDVIDQILKLPDHHADEVFTISASGKNYSVQWAQKTLSLRQASKIIANILVVELPFYNYAFEMCFSSGNEEFLKKRRIVHKERKFPFLPLKKTLLQIADQIAASLGDFTAVHVRRGDKAAWKAKYPHLDNDTRPEQLLNTLPHYASPGTRLYIASDEPSSFFSPLKEVYEVHFAEEFSHLWAPGSVWYNSTKKILGGNPQFDNFMMAAVDYSVFDKAFRRVETFNDLTSDEK